MHSSCDPQLVSLIATLELNCPLVKLSPPETRNQNFCFTLRITVAQNTELYGQTSVLVASEHQTDAGGSSIGRRALPKVNLLRCVNLVRQNFSNLQLLILFNYLLITFLNNIFIYNTIIVSIFVLKIQSYVL